MQILHEDFLLTNQLPSDFGEVVNPFGKSAGDMRREFPGDVEANLSEMRGSHPHNLITDQSELEMNIPLQVRVGIDLDEGLSGCQLAMLNVDPVLKGPNFLIGWVRQLFPFVTGE